MSTWAITCYFNINGSQRRYSNYRAFFEGLNLPLVTVEWSIDGDYELADRDAAILVHVSGGDLLWQKERLINLAVEHLPPDCTNVVWLDCDIVFESESWITDFEKALTSARLVQLFSHVSHRMPADPGARTAIENEAEHLLGRESLAFKYQSMGRQSLLETIPSIAVNKTRQSSADWLEEERFERFRLTTRPSSGHGWGMERDLLERLTLYDSMIFGTGDMAIALAGIGLQSQYVEGYLLGQAHRSHYLNWADQFYRLIDGRVASIPGSLNHLYHGNLSDRQYGARMRMMAQHDFDPVSDLSLSSQGVWQWQGDAASRYRQYMHRYFAGRAEDSPDRLSD